MFLQSKHLQSKCTQLSIKNICKKYLKCDINKDWLGRLYGIINPMIDINGKIDVSSMIIEIDIEGFMQKEMGYFH